MSHHIDYAAISWEQFEDLCVALWFDEGYTDIRPYGRRGEGGRDAVFVDKQSRDLTIFQFKRWTGRYETSQLKHSIREAARKVAGFKPKKFILNSAYVPNPDVNDSIPALANELGFEVEYWDRAWVDLRLDNRRQDLRRYYFGLAVEHHTWGSLAATSVKQIERTRRRLSHKYSPDVYVRREVEQAFADFAQSDKVGFALIDRAGQGKTNVLCAIAAGLLVAGKPAVFIEASGTLVDDYGLVRLLCIELDYGSQEGVDFQRFLRDLARLLSEKGETLFIFVDGLSEADNIRLVTRSLRDLLVRVAEHRYLKVCLACRDIVWPFIQSEIPKELLFSRGSSQEGSRFDIYTYQWPLGYFNDAELEVAFKLYRQKYNLSFDARFPARNQLRHPLLLRFFCEANQNQSLGSLGSVPLSSTFDHYLEVKAREIGVRTDNRFPPSLIMRLLLKLAGRLWQLGSARSISETDVIDIYPPTITTGEGRELLRILEEEGVLGFRSQPLTPERSVYIVFDELQDYLFLKYLLSELPEELRAAWEITKDPSIVLDHFHSVLDNPRVFALLSLIGMILPEVGERRQFLRRLLQWDFYTFCVTLARIAPSGRITRCQHEDLATLAGEIRDWYELIITTTFPQIVPNIDPWIYASPIQLEGSHLRIQLGASPDCRQVSYRYGLAELPDGLIDVRHTPRYPTWSLSISDGTTTVNLNDPEGGIFIPTYRLAGLDGTIAINRTLDPAFGSPFPGVSLNVPERIAVFDVWNGIKEMMKQGEWPQQPTVLLLERARALAFTIPNLTTVEELTLDELHAQIPTLMTQLGQDSRDERDIRTRLDELEYLLDRLGQPLGPSLLPAPDVRISDERRSASHTDYSDETLGVYLMTLLGTAVQAYKLVVDGNLSGITDILSTYAHLPSAVVVLTDRQSVRYALVPVDDSTDAKIHYRNVSDLGLEVTDRTLQIQGNGMTIEEYIQSELHRLGRVRPPIRPIDIIVPIVDLFGPIPIGRLVQEWLSTDLRKVFGL